MKKNLLDNLPDKEKLKFDESEDDDENDNKGISDEDRKLIEINKNYIESKLWNWKEDDNFEFVIPPTIFKEKIIIRGDNDLRYNNELIQYENQDIVGQPFSQEILEQIWQKGEFKINSTIPELPYTWKLSYFTVKGIKNIKLRYQKDMSLSFLFLYSLYYRFSTYNYKGIFPCSFPSSAYHLYQSIYNIINLFFGLPIYSHYIYDIEENIKHQRLLEFLELNKDLDLLFFNSKSKKELRKFDEEFNTVWWTEIEPRLVKKYKEQNMNKEELNSNLVEDKKREFFNFLNQNNRKFKEFEDLHPSTKDYILSQQIINDASFFYKLEKEQKIENFRNELKKNYIRDLCELWHEDKMDEYYRKVTKETDDEKERKIKRDIQSRKEPSSVYNYNLNNEKDIPDLIKEQLKKEKRPFETYEIKRYLTRPYEKYQEETNNGEVRYYLRKYKYHEVKTSFIFWRVILFLIKYFCSFWNFNIFIYRQMLDSMLGIKALCSFTLYRDYTIDEFTGRITKAKETFTFPKSIYNLWTWVMESRRNFESAPDTGILGKGCTRIFHLFLNYILRLLILGSLLIILYPSFITLNIFICFCLIICSPFLIALWILLDFLFCLIIYNRYDKLKLFPLIRIIIIDFIIGFILQLIMSLLSIIIQPVLTIFFFLYSQIHFLLRYLYDLFFYSIFKCLGKVPETNNCIAWLISGPGLFRERYYDIKNKDILSLVIGELEKRIMKNYNNRIKELLDSPREAIQDIQNVYKRVGLNYNINNKINKSIDFYREKLKNKIKKRDVYPECEINVKFTEERLEEVKNMIELYITEYSKVNDISFELDKFEEKKIENLTQEIMKEIFGNNIFEPLQSNDKIVHLQSVFKNELDNIATKIFENPKFDDRIYIEERPKEKKVINYPEFANFHQIFNGYLNLDLSLLKKEEKNLFPILADMLI